MLLAQAGPGWSEWPDAALDEFSLGQRDSWLLDLRRRTFGAAVAGMVRCPACGERLAIDSDVDTLLFDSLRVEAGPGRVTRVVCGETTVVARPVDGAALRAAARAGAHGGVAAARASLVASCVVSASGPDGEAVAVSSLPDDVVAAVGEAISEADPQAEVRLQLDCALCGHSWSALFDVTAFFCAELDAEAVRLVEDVHVLAQAYGWPEHEILALSPRRRRTYVERALDG
jgi:hypothetical protein